MQRISLIFCQTLCPNPARLISKTVFTATTSSEVEEENGRGYENNAITFNRKSKNFRVDLESRTLILASSLKRWCETLKFQLLGYISHIYILLKGRQSDTVNI